MSHDPTVSDTNVLIYTSPCFSKKVFLVRWMVSMTLVRMVGSRSLTVRYAKDLHRNKIKEVWGFTCECVMICIKHLSNQWYMKCLFHKQHSFNLLMGTLGIFIPSILFLHFLSFVSLGVVLIVSKKWKIRSITVTVLHCCTLGSS